MTRGTRNVATRQTHKGLTLLSAGLFVFSVLLQTAVFAAPSVATAASGLKADTVQGFEVDGNLASSDAHTNPGAIPTSLLGSNPMADGKDWLDANGVQGVVDPATPPTSATIADPTNSSSDDIFTSGSKELDTRTWDYSTGKPTPKDDLKHVMAYAKFVGNSAFFYMGAERIINNGSTHLDFELNKNPFKTWSDGLSKADRSNGDLLISLDFSNGGGDPQVTVYKFSNVQTFASGQTADVKTSPRRPPSIRRRISSTSRLTRASATRSPASSSRKRRSTWLPSVSRPHARACRAASSGPGPAMTRLLGAQGQGRPLPDRPE